MLTRGELTLRRRNEAQKGELDEQLKVRQVQGLSDLP
jgi:hypothetical protein